MELVLFTDNQSGDIKNVVSQANRKYLSEDDLSKGFVFNVEDIPKPEIKSGKLANLKINVKTNELFYEYVDRPLTQDEELAKVRAENEILTESLIDFKTQYMAVPCQNHQDYPVVIDKIIEEAKKDGTV